MLKIDLVVKESLGGAVLKTKACGHRGQGTVNGCAPLEGGGASKQDQLARSKARNILIPCNGPVDGLPHSDNRRNSVVTRLDFEQKIFNNQLLIVVKRAIIISYYK